MEGASGGRGGEGCRLHEAGDLLESGVACGPAGGDEGPDAGGQGLPSFAQSYTAGQGSRPVSLPSPGSQHDVQQGEQPPTPVQVGLTCISPTPDSQELEGSVLSQNGVARMGLRERQYEADFTPRRRVLSLYPLTSSSQGGGQSARAVTVDQVTF